MRARPRDTPTDGSVVGSELAEQRHSTEHTRNRTRKARSRRTEPMPTGGRIRRSSLQRRVRHRVRRLGDHQGDPRRLPVAREELHPVQHEPDQEQQEEDQDDVEQQRRRRAARVSSGCRSPHASAARPRGRRPRRRPRRARARAGRPCWSPARWRRAGRR